MEVQTESQSSTIESWLLTLGDRDIELQCLKLSSAARVHRLICTGSECTIFVGRLTMTRRIVTCVLPIGRHRQSRPSHDSCPSNRSRQLQVSLRFPGNESFSFLNAKVASQLNFDDLRNVRQALIIHSTSSQPSSISALILG